MAPMGVHDMHAVHEMLKIAHVDLCIGITSTVSQHLCYLKYHCKEAELSFT